MALFALACGWLLGLALGLRLGPPVAAAVALLPLPLAAALLARRERALLLTALLLLALLAGLARAGLAMSGGTQALDPRGLIGQEAALTGVVRGGPVRREASSRIVVDLATVEAEDGADVPMGGAVAAWVAVAEGERLFPGDRVRLTGRVEGAPRFPDFDYAAVLEREGVTAALYRPRLEVIAPSQGPSRWLTAARRDLGASLARGLPEPQASLAQAVLLGRRDGLTPGLRDEWARAGMAHLLAVSGLHVGVVLGIGMSLGAAILGRRRGLYLFLPLALVWGYAALAGLGAPVQRAAVMGTLYLAAMGLGRQSSGGLALLLAAAVLAGVNPAALGEASFQLSVAAMAGLIYLGPPIEAGLRRLAAGNGASASPLAEATVGGIAASLAATAATFPLLAHHFGAASLLAVPATLLSLFALPPLLAFSALAAAGGLVSESLGQAAGWLAWAPLSYLLALASGLGRLPFASLSIGPIGPVGVAALYGGMALALWRPVLGRPSGLLGAAALGPDLGRPVAMLDLGALARPAALGVVLLVAAPLWTAVAAPAMTPDRLAVSFLDVGQGDAILVETPGGRRVLVDGGPDPRVLERRLAEELPWWSRRLDVVVLTHPNADHVGGLIETVRRRDVGLVVDPQLAADTSMARQWEETLAVTGTPVVRAIRGLRIDVGDGVLLEALHPPEPRLAGGGSYLDDNAVVLRVSYGRASFLLGADLFAYGEDALVASGQPLGAAVLKVMHHGSANASSTPFVAAVHPLVAVVSAGADNPFGHPAPEALDRLTEAAAPGLHLLRTDRDGTVHITTDGEHMWVTTGRRAGGGGAR